MYKIFLCLRYLRTRYIVLASIISVMLGVATMIVVNSVMAGFAKEMQTRIHGILGDLIVTSSNADGFYDPELQIQRIRDTLGDQVESLTPICTTVGVLTYKTNYIGDDGEEHPAMLTDQVFIVGIDEKSRGSVGDFGKFLQHPENRKALTFALRDGGFNTFENQEDTQSRGILGQIFPEKDRKKGKLKERTEMKRAGWQHRRDFYTEEVNERERRKEREASFRLQMESENVSAEVHPTMKKAEEENPAILDAMDDSSATKTLNDHSMGSNPFYSSDPNAAEETPEADTNGDPVLETQDQEQPGIIDIEDPFGGKGDNPNGDSDFEEFNPLKETHPGIIVGIGLATRRLTDGTDKFLLLPGRDVALTFPDCGNANTPPKGVTAHFTCVDLYESKMSEYDSSFVFVPMKELQKLRGMDNKANQIQIKLKPGADLDEACMQLKQVFDPQFFSCNTWRDDKMPLLQAVDMEIAILNVLLFMIIAVSGFGILAIFYMVVTEKTRDIGILKALGASSWGIMSIFLIYGLALGIVGAGLGMILGLAFVMNINEVADFLSWCLGHEVFSPDIYYFYQVPYDISLWTVGWIVGGALFIAVLASVFPAWHASRLQPVESLRYE